MEPNSIRIDTDFNEWLMLNYGPFSINWVTHEFSSLDSIFS